MVLLCLNQNDIAFMKRKRSKIPETGMRYRECKKRTRYRKSRIAFPLKIKRAAGTKINRILYLTLCFPFRWHFSRAVPNCRENRNVVAMSLLNRCNSPLREMWNCADTERKKELHIAASVTTPLYLHSLTGRLGAKRKLKLLRLSRGKITVREYSQQSCGFARESRYGKRGKYTD